MYKINNLSNVVLGQFQEQNSRSVLIDVSEWKPEENSVFSIIARRPTENTDYFVENVEVNENILKWTLTAFDMFILGQGKATIIMSTDTKIMKTPTFNTIINESLPNEAEETPPEPIPNWYTNVLLKADEIIGSRVEHFEINAEGHLIATLEDGTTEDLGSVVGSGGVSSVNGQTGNVVLNAEDVGALPGDTIIPSKTSDLTNDSGYITNAVNNLINYYLKSETYNKTEINSLISQIEGLINTALASYYTKTEVDTALGNKENTSNKVTSLSAQSTDTQYPSAKCVYDNLGTKQNVIDSTHKLDYSLLDNTPTIPIVDQTYDGTSANAQSGTAVAEAITPIEEAIKNKPGATTSEQGEVFNNYTNNVASAKYSHAEGNTTEATANASHAEGYKVKVSGAAAHGEGVLTEAKGTSSHTEGRGTVALGYVAHAEGHKTEAIGHGSHTEGAITKAISDNAHAEGVSTVAGTKGFKITNIEIDTTKNTGTLFIIDGSNVVIPEQPESEYDEPVEYVTDKVTECYAIGDLLNIDVDKHQYGKYSITSLEDGKIHFAGIDPFNVTNAADELVLGSAAEDNYVWVENKHFGETIDQFSGVHAEGSYTTAIGWGAHSEGRNTKAIGNYSHAEGRQTIANYGAHAEGRGTKAKGHMSHTEGQNTTAIGECSHAEGNGTTAQRYYSHAEGKETKAFGDSSHAEGCYSEALAKHSHAEGRSCKAGKDNNTGTAAHAEGSYTVSLSYGTHTEGVSTIAYSMYNHSEGFLTRSGDENDANQAIAAHAEGAGSKALNNYSHAGGLCTKTGNDCQTVIGRANVGKADTLFEIGCGTVTPSTNSGGTITGFDESKIVRKNVFEISDAEDGTLTLGGVSITVAQLQKLLALIQD